MLNTEDETFGQPFRRGRETRAEQAVNTFGGEPNVVTFKLNLNQHSHWNLNEPPCRV